MIGGKKFRVAAFIADYSSTFVSIFIIYILYDCSSLRTVMEKRFSAGRRDAFFTLLIVSLVINIVRTICSNFVYRNAKDPDRAQKSFYRGAVAAVLSVVWFVIVLIQIISKNWLVTYRGIEVILLVMSLVDFVVYPIMLYCSYKNSKQVYIPDAMSAIEGNPKQTLPPIKLPAQNGFAQQQGFDRDGNKRV